MASLKRRLSLGAVRPDVAVVDEQDVDCTQAGAQQRLLDRAHRAVVRIVEARRMPVAADEPRREHILVARRRLREGIHHAPDLGRDDDLASLGTTQACTHARFGNAVAVVRRRVEDAHAAREGLLHRRDARLLVEDFVDLAHGRCAQADGRKHQLRGVAGLECTCLHDVSSRQQSRCDVAPTDRRTRIAHMICARRGRGGPVVRVARAL